MAPDREAVTAGPPAPTHLSVKLPPAAAAILHRVAYETGRSKQDLVTGAIIAVYGGAGVRK
jgi:hypothetical protein